MPEVRLGRNSPNLDDLRVFQLWLAFFLSLSGLLVRPGDNVTFICFSVLGGLAMGGYFATPEAMKPDVVDYDEFRTGARYPCTRIPLI